MYKNIVIRKRSFMLHYLNCTMKRILVLFCFEALQRNNIVNAHY